MAVHLGINVATLRFMAWLPTKWRASGCVVGRAAPIYNLPVERAYVARSRHWGARTQLRRDSGLGIIQGLLLGERRWYVFMTFSEAKQEFAVRHYLWGQFEFKREIDESFPLMRSFKAGRIWKRYRFMQQIDEREQLILASGLLKRANPDAVQALGESFTPDEETLLAQLREFSLHPKGFGAETEARKSAEERIGFASKAKLRRAVMNQFEGAFGSQCINLAIVGLDPEMNFKMKCCGWLLSTDFTFNGVKRQVAYSHRIRSEMSKERDGVRDIILGFPSLSGWLGTRGDTSWEYLLDEDIQLVCDFIIQRCRHWFDVAPKLLKGLECEKMASGISQLQPDANR